jgi:hypothetical protein
MAYETSDAIGLDAMFDAIVLFAAAQGWQIVEDFRNTAGKEWIILKGEGLAATDQIFVGLKKYRSVLFDTYGIRFQGFTGYQSGVAFDSQAGAMPFDNAGRFTPTIPLWSNSMKYWITGNARHIKIVAKVSASYEAAYFGFLLPYGTAKQFPYPLVIGGSAVADSRYDRNDAVHTHFAIPYFGTTDSSLRLRDASGTWRSFGIVGNSGGEGYSVFPFQEVSSRSNRQGWNYLISTPNDASPANPVFPIQPVIPYRRVTSESVVDVYGELDGVFSVPSLNNAVENILEIGGDDYLVVQNVFRNSVGHFWAMKLA